MTNSDIVEQLELTGKLLELHGENDFKVRGYQNAAFSLDKTTADLLTLPVAELSKLPGVGKSIAVRIDEIRRTGTTPELEELLGKTPEGVLQMFRIKGIGPKKIRQIWLDLGIQDTHDLLIACEAGEVAKLKGFGEKTQETIRTNLLFLQANAAKLRMDVAAALGGVLVEALENAGFEAVVTGELRRQSEVVSQIELLVATDEPLRVQVVLNDLDFLVQDRAASSPFVWRGKFVDKKIPLDIRTCRPAELARQQFLRSAAEGHLRHLTERGTLRSAALREHFTTEEEFYQKLQLPYILPEQREGVLEWKSEFRSQQLGLITWDALRGIVHNHSTYSDGKHTLEQMARHCQELGFEYFGIADHSQSATYANGLPPYRIEQQHAEIDRLNETFAAEGTSFRILKGIESDILGDGSLDYPDEVLARFDYVVASIHSNLKMTEERAMQRLLGAIENPYTTILGHPTGRLLLIREGYPVDYRMLIDACAANGVVIELNASPYRLDLDWRWIPYALEKGVMISINPDAHEQAGFQDMHYGVAVARKGGLTRDMTFNALGLAEMLGYLAKRKING